MMSPVGGVIGPLLMGYVADASSMVTAFIVPWMGYAVVAVYGYVMLRKSAREQLL